MHPCTMYINLIEYPGSSYGVTDRFLGSQYLLPMQLKMTLVATYIIIIACCEFIQPVRHVCSLE